MLYLQIASPKSSVLNFLDSNSFEVIISIFQRTEKVPDMERLQAKEVTMILHYSTEGSIHVSDNLEDVLSQIGMNANDIALAKVKYYVLHTQMISILLYLTAKPLLHASQPDKIIGTTRSTPGQSVFDNVCFVPDSKRHSDKFKRYFE